MGMAIGLADFQSSITEIDLDTCNLPYKGYACNACASSVAALTAGAMLSAAPKVSDASSAPLSSPVQSADPLDGLRWEAKLKGCPWKRAFDIFGAFALILLTSPLMLLAFVIIRLQDGGEAIFAQARVGLHGQTFKCFKFRSMVKNAEQKLQTYLHDNPTARDEWETNRKLKDDPRITRFGNFIRKSSIDELPQLFNVLRGEMSLVGPRPVVPDEIERYGMQAIHYLRVRPGLTGLWQVSGRSDTSYDARVLLDREYALTRNFWGDVSILLKTVPAVLKSDGAV